MHDTQPSFEVVTITPQVAKAMLAGQENVRPVRSTKVETYAEAMEEKQWSLTGEPITFNGTRLLNGFHRLSACVLSDTPFVTVVARGIPAASVADMDSGLQRTAGDVIRGRGIPNGEFAAATARLLIGWADGRIMEARRLTAISRPSIIAYVSAHQQEIHDADAPARTLRSAVGGGKAPYAAVYIRLNHVMRDEFFATVSSGANLPSGDARLALRRWLLNRAVQQKRSPAHVTIIQVIKAWNMWVAGVPTAHLKASSAMEMPEIATP